MQASRPSPLYRSPPVSLQLKRPSLHSRGRTPRWAFDPVRNTCYVAISYLGIERASPSSNTDRSQLEIGPQISGSYTRQPSWEDGVGRRGGPSHRNADSNRQLQGHSSTCAIWMLSVGRLLRDPLNGMGMGMGRDRVTRPKPRLLPEARRRTASISCHAVAVSGGCSRTRGRYSTSCVRPWKVLLAVTSTATSG